MQPAVDPYDGFSFGPQRSSLVLAETFCRRKPSGDFLVSREIVLVFRRRNDGQIDGPALR